MLDLFSALVADILLPLISHHIATCHHAATRQLQQRMKLLSLSPLGLQQDPVTPKLKK